MKKLDKLIVIISDCHLSAGRFHEGQLNPHEDFYFDDEMCDLFEHFSSGEYGDGPSGSLPVELFINGDYLDFLNVPVGGDFEDTVTEDIAVQKLEAIFKGHPKVMKALREFASKPGKTITYLIGNHDFELVFPKVRERITREWDPEGRFPSEKVRVIADSDRVFYDEGVEVRHGNQFEPGSQLDFETALVRTRDGRQILNLPWGSIYVIKIVNRLKWEREYLDKIRPIKVFVLFGLVLDPWFTVRFAFLSLYYFFKTRVAAAFRGRSGLRRVWEIVREETTLFQDLEKPARQILDESPRVNTVIFGHTHRPMDKIYSDGKQYINTGTWTKMIDLDYRGLGQQFRRTFALVQISDGKARCELRQWVGEHSPHKHFSG